MDNNERFIIDNILNDMSDGVIVISFDGKIVLFNKPACTSLNVTDGDLSGKSIAILMDEFEENDEFFELLLDAVYTKKKVSRIVPFSIDGSLKYLLVTTSFLTRGDEKIALIAVISDHTEYANLFIDKKYLANQVADLMNSFVAAMVTAVEEKSAYNANHTKNVVRYITSYLSWLSDQGRLGEYTSEDTSPLIMSVWLHDIGKLLLPQKILDKPTRLGDQITEIKHRTETARLMLRIEKLSHPEKAEEADEKLLRIDEAEKLIFSADTLPVLDSEMIGRLREAAAVECLRSDGTPTTLLTDSELDSITVEKGTLTAEERRIVESHVELTEKLLSTVEFRGCFAPVPEWATGHHEYLDGTGYPKQLRGEEIPWETRLLTIIDIYDALTADDRPYKPPTPPEEAFSILREMAEGGKLDSEILESFHESGVWNKG